MVLNSPKGFLEIFSSDLSLLLFSKLKHPKSLTFGIDALPFCIRMAQCHPSSPAFSQRAKIKESPIIDENFIIWNRGTSTEQKQFLVEPEGYNPSLMTCYQLEQLRLYKSWCVFGHNEYSKNLIGILQEITRWIYGQSATIPNRILGFFHWIKKKSSHLLHVEPN